MNRRTAFTLAELVTVIVLTTILSAGALAGLRGLGRWRDATAQRRLVADLRHARALAMLTGRRTMVVFDLASQSWRLEQEDQPAEGSFRGSTIIHPQSFQPWVVRLPDIASSLRIASLTNVSGGRIGFAADGLPIDAAGNRPRKSAVITLNNGRLVAVYAGSGFCEVK